MAEKSDFPPLPTPTRRWRRATFSTPSVHRWNTKDHRQFLIQDIVKSHASSAQGTKEPGRKLMRRTSRPSRITCPVVATAICCVTSYQHALADLPVSYLHGNGSKAYPVVSLTWGLLAISVVVTVIVCALLVFGIIMRRTRTDEIAAIPVGRSGGGMPWLVWGTGISTVALFGSLVWT